MFLALSATLITAATIGAAPPRLPSGPIPDGLGVNIHFTDPRKGEMEMMAAGGFTWVRMDYDWNYVEYERGSYRFESYDRLMAALEAHHMRPIFILDYVNHLYDDGQSPHSEEAIDAFARFAAASAKHFRGRGILWEMYNEPNISFWRPKPNVEDYVRLATAVGKAIRAEAPQEAYIGPATSTIDFSFLEACFKAGLLEYWDAVSVHPYRQTPPETVMPEYARLRDLIRRYAPKGKQVPIISGEWGYSSAWNGMDPDKQGKMLARQWLTNIACGVPLSIWYDWHDDGLDPKEPEHHFGTVLNPYKPDTTPVYDPKPAYLAAQALTRYLNGFRFSKRLVVGDANQFVLLFRKGREVRLAAWSMAQSGADVVIPASDGPFEAQNHLGKPLAEVNANGGGLRIHLTDAPTYLRPLRPNAVLSLAAAWDSLPLEIPTPHRPSIVVRTILTNVTDQTIKVNDGMGTKTLAPSQRCEVSKTVRLERSEKPTVARLAITIDGSAPIAQETEVIVTNPLSVRVCPPYGGALSFILGNPSAEPFDGVAILTVSTTEGSKRVERRVKLQGGAPETPIDLPVGAVGNEATVGVELRDAKGAKVLSAGPVRFLPLLDDFGGRATDKEPALDLAPDGDSKVQSQQTLAVAAPPEGPPQPGMRVYRFSYRYDNGWKFVRVFPARDEDRSIPDRPSALGMWIYGDGKGNLVRVRFTDSTNQTFQPDGETISWKGWRYVEIRLDGSRGGHWGGADDGVVHYPIRWDTVFLLDSAGGRATEGEVYFAGLTLIY